MQWTLHHPHRSFHHQDSLLFICSQSNMTTGPFSIRIRLTDFITAGWQIKTRATHFSPQEIELVLFEQVLPYSVSLFPSVSQEVGMLRCELAERKALQMYLRPSSSEQTQTKRMHVYSLRQANNDADASKIWISNERGKMQMTRYAECGRFTYLPRRSTILCSVKPRPDTKLIIVQFSWETGWDPVMPGRHEEELELPPGETMRKILLINQNFRFYLFSSPKGSGSRFGFAPT